jgi:hypothetical protein
MSNLIANTTFAVAPVAKLYKRCAWGSHKSCAGAFEKHSVCSCPCHAPVEAKAPVKSRKARVMAKVADAPKVAPVAAVKPNAAQIAAIIADALVKAGLV